jgi:hypothetical protein
LRWRDYRQKILTTIDNESFYVDEFKQLNLQCHRQGNELKGQCPFKEMHAAGQDRNPSFTVNLSTGVYFCNACGSKGNVHTFYMQTRAVTSQVAWFELGDALGIERPEAVDSRPAIDPGLPNKWHKALMESTGVIRDILRDKRGLTDATLARFLIGWDGERVTIPIYDEFNELVNVRRYMWNSYEDNTKMINYTDEVGNTYGEDRIFGIEHLFNKECTAVLWCEGEWDRILAEQNDMPACTTTAGANNFRAEWFKLLKTKKRLYIAYDNDEAGRLATEYMVDNLRGSVDLWPISWPKDWREKGDITDIFAKDSYNKESFMALFKPLDKSEDIPVVPLAVSSNARYAGKRIKIPVLIAGKESSPYVYPKSVRISCDAGDEEKKPCQSCNLLFKKCVNISLTSADQLMLKLIDVPDDRQIAALKSVAGCNQKCTCMDYKVLEYGNLETCHLIPKADVSFGFAQRSEYVARSGYIIGNNIPTNKRFTLVGYMHADPMTQKATYIFDQAIPEKDLLDDLEVTEELHARLLDFQCSPGQSVAEKFEEIHDDLERNVTYIWNRRKVAYAVDLVYHTALSFKFQEQQVKRGWAECLIIGDSGQAKTTLVERLMAHYRCGELLSGESSKRTGLVYSLQQGASGKGNWTLIWGAMPLNDGGLLTVDELSGMPEDDLAKMSDVRSSGIAKSTGVISAETTARTRIIFISNPRNGRQLKAENYGVSTILKLFGKAEDVRRLDFAVAVASGEVDSDVVNKSVVDMPLVAHRFTSDKCHLRVQWAWSRRPENILFTDDATKLILEEASRMGKKYNSRIPLVEPADQRLKIARLSVSAAACVYSTDDGTNVIVKQEHVAFVVDYLNSAYCTKAMGYDRFSADEFENSDTTDESMVRLRNDFISIPFVSREIPELIKLLYSLPYFNRNTLEDAMGIDRDELKYLMHFLISNSIVEKCGQDYRRTQMGLAFIESMILTPATEDDIKAARQRRFAKSEI